ncbi:winged helix-turn-helix transcriptional regulator [Clostridium saccharobutylicum]|uniref:winged helix-turn-helix transcriptional regulator n=1 Tax=Clostridium saccharobutylicum TaxID=169679 RepID=UPI0015FE4DB0|nr:helix-turn-helix domain-containing protein [Clostridium saccharobutylicum]MBA9009322.1 DNA-binding HxlR family transcriptional regulator [Clostridium saccharobutylicum]MBC2440691.1 helix-turn-helix transcriptional regulator [Clostridium saccharobutylicum]MBC2515406.1 helix-turn-helix transcriptional regulator [Clostridium saccharobutylicum]MBC2559597.1 helix-turn-helix transcriptional regulator [Clostridium saccharobutylicum]
MPKNEEQEVINERNCVMIYSMEILGGKWRVPIIWKLYQNKAMRYNELKRNLVGITNIMLTRSLKSLEENGLVSRVEFNQIPPRVEYSLTDNCLQIVPALETIFNWGKERMTKEN